MLTAAGLDIRRREPDVLRRPHAVRQTAEGIEPDESQHRQGSDRRKDDQDDLAGAHARLARRRQRRRRVHAQEFSRSLTAPIVCQMKTTPKGAARFARQSVAVRMQ